MKFVFKALFKPNSNLSNRIEQTPTGFENLSGSIFVFCNSISVIRRRIR